MVAVFLHLPVAQTELVAKRTEHQYSAWRFITFYLNDILLFNCFHSDIFYTVCNLFLRHHLHYRTTLYFSTTVFWHCMKAAVKRSGITRLGCKITTIIFFNDPKIAFFVMPLCSLLLCLSSVQMYSILRIDFFLLR